MNKAGKIIIIQIKTLDTLCSKAIVPMILFPGAHSPEGISIFLQDKHMMK